MRAEAAGPNAPNPYQSPSDLPPSALPDPIDDVLRSVDRLDFDTIIERRDLIDAVAATPLRHEVGSLRRVMAVFLVPFALITSFAFMSGSRRIAIVLSLVGVTLLVFLVVMRYRLIRSFAKMCQDMLGPATGYIDGQNLVIEQEQQTRILDLKKIVCVTRNRRRMVLCFDATLYRFETLPLDGFQSPDAARMLADQLSHLRPPVKPQPVDRRRAELTTVAPLFKPNDQAIYYSGPVSSVNFEGSSIDNRWRRVIFGALAKILLALAIVVTLLLWTLGSSTATLIACLIAFTAFIPAWLRVLKFHREFHRTDQPLWQAKGWIESGGIVSMTTIGQTKSKWTLFGKLTLTPRSIVLQYATAPLWYVLSRDQFSGDGDWNAACQLVREKIAAG